MLPAIQYIYTPGLEAHGSLAYLIIVFPMLLCMQATMESALSGAQEEYRKKLEQALEEERERSQKAIERALEEERSKTASNVEEIKVVRYIVLKVHVCFIDLN